MNNIPNLIINLFKKKKKLLYTNGKIQKVISILSFIADCGLYLLKMVDLSIVKIAVKSLR